MKKLIGSYTVTSEYAPIEYQITLHVDHTVSMTEVSPMGEYKCEGTATIEENVITSEVTCEGGYEFTQKINMEGIEEVEEFTASVHSSLYEAEVPMNFVKTE